MACCVLHNICLDHNDPYVEEYCEEGMEYLEAVNQLPDVCTREESEEESEADTRRGSSKIRERLFQEYRQQN